MSVLNIKVDYKTKTVSLNLDELRKLYKEADVRSRRVLESIFTKDLIEDTEEIMKRMNRSAIGFAVTHGYISQADLENESYWESDYFNFKKCYKDKEKKYGNSSSTNKKNGAEK